MVLLVRRKADEDDVTLLKMGWRRTSLACLKPVMARQDPPPPRSGPSPGQSPLPPPYPKHEYLSHLRHNKIKNISILLLLVLPLAAVAVCVIELTSKPGQV